MPDIQLRFGRDMLVLSAPVAPVLARQGFAPDGDIEYATLMEPEAVRDALRLNLTAGAHCLVAETASMTPARLAHRGMADRLDELMAAALGIVNELKPQHALVEVGPCGLPLDASSKASLNENRDQYARVARACNEGPLDAFFLNGFTNPADLKCALMGVRQVSSLPVLASVDVAEGGMLADGRHTFEEALEVMASLQANVAGFSTKLPLDQACELAKVADEAHLPVLAQLDVAEHNPRQRAATADNPYYCPDVAVDAAVALRAAGVEFLRAVGAATPAYTGALVAAVDGADVVIPSAK